MNRLNALVLAGLLSSAFFAFAQAPYGKPKSAPVPSAQAAPKATKKDAKAQCRSEGKSGKELLECIKTRSQGE